MIINLWLTFFSNESFLCMEREEEHRDWRMYLDRVVSIHENGIKAVLFHQQLLISL